MSEFMFAVRRDSRRALTAHEVARRDRIVKAEGGYGYTYYREASGDWIGWASGSNHGDPVDRDLARRVQARMERDADQAR